MALLAVVFGTLFFGAGCGSDEPAAGNGGAMAIGPNGGTVTSADGKVTLTIPPGALTETIRVAITKTNSGSDPDLVAGTTYQLDAPSVELTAAATMTYDLSDAILPAAAAGLHPETTLVGDCTPTQDTCFVVLGSGECPADHDKLVGIADVSVVNGKPVPPTWAQECALSDPPQPILATLEPSTLYGGVFDGLAHRLTGSLIHLSPAIFAVLDTKLGLDWTGAPLPVDATTFANGTEQPVTFTITPSRPATIAKYKYYMDGAVAFHADGTSDTSLNPQGVPVGESTTSTFSQKFASSATDPSLTYVYFFVEVAAVDAASNVMANRVMVVPVAYGKQLGVSLDASYTTVVVASTTTLVANPLNAVAGVQKVEFFEGASKIGEDATAPTYYLDVPYTQANDGNHVYHAQITDLLGQTAVSNDVAVNVAINPAPTFDYYVDPVGGLDTNPGTAAQPFKTIAHMGTVAVSGKKIGLMDGTYLEGTTLGTCDGRAVAVPGGLTIRAVHPRAAVLANFTLTVASGSLTLTDVTFDGGAANGGCTGINASSPTSGDTLTMSGIAFANSSHVVLSGAVAATLTPGTLAGSYVSGTRFALATLSGTSKLQINGGTIDGATTSTQCGTAQFALTNSAQLVLDNVNVKNYPGQMVVAVNSTAVTLQNNTLVDHVAYQSGCGSVATLGDTAVFAMNAATIQNATGGNAIEVRSGTPVQVSLTGSALKSNVRGIFHNTSFGDGAATITLSGSTIQSSTQEAMSWTTSLNPGLTLSVRNSMITSNAKGFYLYAGTGSSIDLGTSGSPGGNTIQNTGTGIALDGATTITANVSGNTWVASVQGADAAGHYGATAVTGPATSGNNYQIVNGSSLQF